MKTLILACSVIAALAVLAGGCVSHSGRPQSRSPAPVKSALMVQRNLVYTPPGWPQALAADVYMPRTPGVYPGVIMVHGGGWDARDRSDMESISEKLARRGYVVANIQYRLAPAFRYPAPLDDVRAATLWMRANAARFRLDPERVAGWGYSAGAHLVALAATANSSPAARFQAVVAGAAPTNLPRYPDSPIITKFIGTSYAAKPKTWSDASPITHVTAGTPPMFLYHGKWDRLVYAEDSVAMKERLQQAGVPVELYLVRGTGHITTFLADFGAEDAGIDFLDRQFRP